MTDHPILFKADMIRAILDGRKSQTRRIIKPQPEKILQGDWSELCKYKPGDLLWVRETWWAVEVDKIGVQYCVFDDEFEIEALGGQYPAPDILRLLDRQNWRYGRHPNIHLPKKQCRLWLKVKSVRVERVQEITFDDLCAEGRPSGWLTTDGNERVIDWFMGLWDSINGKKYPWKSNPFVWVIEFERHN